MLKTQVNKVELGPLIDLLVQIYGSGADYVDIALKQGDNNQDALGIFLREEYFNYERIEQESMPDENPIDLKNLTDEQINQLLGL